MNTLKNNPFNPDKLLTDLVSSLRIKTEYLTNEHDKLICDIHTPREATQEEREALYAEGAKKFQDFYGEDPESDYNDSMEEGK